MGPSIIRVSSRRSTRSWSSRGRRDQVHRDGGWGRMTRRARRSRRLPAFLRKTLRSCPSPPTDGLSSHCDFFGYPSPATFTADRVLEQHAPVRRCAGVPSAREGARQSVESLCRSVRSGAAHCAGGLEEPWGDARPPRRGFLCVRLSLSIVLHSRSSRAMSSGSVFSVRVRYFSCPVNRGNPLVAICRNRLKTERQSRGRDRGACCASHNRTLETVRPRLLFRQRRPAV